MSKDYAHRGNGGRQTSNGGMPGWLWLIVGVGRGVARAPGENKTPPAGGPHVAAPNGGKARAHRKKKIAIPPKEPTPVTI
jgi:hypothetical protein